MLHVHGTTGVSDASEYLSQHLDVHSAETEPFIYFTFDKYDSQRNSVIGMLNSIQSQIYSHLPVYHDAALLPQEQMAFYHSWTVSELYTMFRNFCTNVSHAGSYMVINGLDECDESILSFLKNLCYLVGTTEYKIKMVLASTTKLSIQSVLAEWPTICLDDHVPTTADANHEALASEVELEVVHLVQDFPSLYSFETSITEKLLKCGQDQDWRRLVLKQLQTIDQGPRNLAIQKKLDSIQVNSPHDTLREILSRIPFERQPWAHKALSWIIYSFRPLSVWELALAFAPGVDGLPNTALDSDSIYQAFTADLNNLFGGAIIIKHNQVRFGHLDAREFFTALDQRPDARRSAHRDILDTCYKYLSLEQVQDTLVALYANATDVEIPAFTHQYNLIEYAVKYWPKHFEIIAENSPSKQDLEFVQNAKAMRVWAEAYWCLSNPNYRRDRGFLSLLPVFAGLGLQSLVKEWLATDAKSPRASQDRGLALVEATRYGQIEIFRLLLTYRDYTESVLRDALFAATSSTDGPVLDELVTYIGKTIEKFDWPSTTVLRASQFGHDRILRKLLEFGASPNKGIEMHSMNPLYAAAREGKTEVIKVLLEFKASITARAQHQRTPFHASCVFGHVDIAKLLLDAGANIDEMDDDNDTPICLAVQWGNYQIAEAITKLPCSLDGTCDGRATRTPMTIVADRGYIKCARAMLENKASTEVECGSNWTPLRYTITRQNMEFTKLLLQHGANPNTTQGGEPLLGVVASDGEMFETVKLLVEHGATIDAVNSMGATALHAAAENNHTEIVTYLLDRGAAINLRNSTGNTALHLAASASHSDTVKILLDKGADISIPTNDDWTPIQLSYDHVETTRLLMEAGANANKITGGYTPLYLAAYYGYTEVMKVLVSYPINLEFEYKNESYQNNYTALTIAITNEKNDSARVLLEAGANVNHLSERNNFCLQYAVRTDDPSILRTLMEYKPIMDRQDDDGDTAVNYIRETAPIEMYQILVNGGASIEIPNKEYNTAICKAAMVNTRPDILKYLISKKANLNPVGCKLGGPLHIACRRANVEFVEILVQAGADVNLVSNSVAGNPLQAAARCWDGIRSQEVQEKIIRYLINEAKADVTVLGGMQGCALNAICGWAGVEMVKLLLEKGAKTDVIDEMGRTVIHYAAMKNLENLQHIVSIGVEIDAEDYMGRSAMHWAVVSGSLEVVERVLSLSRRLLDQPDNDGWTPLLWAARGCVTTHKETAITSQEQIINLLLDQGANILVRGKGIDREWTPIQVARYHNLDDEIIQLLIKKTKERLGKEELYHESEHECLKASAQGGSCDSCHCVSFHIGSLPSTFASKGLTFLKSNCWATATNVMTVWTSISATSATYHGLSCIAKTTLSRSLARNLSRLLRLRRRVPKTTMMIQMMTQMTTQMMIPTMTMRRRERRRKRVRLKRVRR